MVSIPRFNWFFLSWSLLIMLRSAGHGIGLPITTRLTDLFTRVSFDNGFSLLFGEENVRVLDNGTGVSIMLSKHTGSGFVSKGKYHYGFFSTNMKLPSGYSAGVVVAFYVSNSDAYPRNHDEIDFELLGHESRREWVLQTNLYGNGSTSAGREEKFRLWFDPSKDFHSYSILWNDHHIVYLVDNIPIREVVHNEATSRVYPSKPMSVYATIWDGSDWATHGGKKPVDYRFVPFVASFSGMQMEGCLQSDGADVGTCSGGEQVGDVVADPVEGRDFVALSAQQKAGLEWARKEFMTYSYCTDRNRYRILPPECS